MADQKSETVRVLYRCKTHGHVVRRTFEQVTHSHPYVAHIDGFSFKKRRVTRVEYFEAGILVRTMHLPDTVCPSSADGPIKHAMTPKLIHGQFVEHNACNEKCLNAIGPDCNCSCGGENHGKAHEAIVAVAVS